MNRVLILGVVFALSLGAYFAFAFEPREFELPDTATWDERTAFWEDAIQEKGAIDAYRRFADSVAERSRGEQHAWAHAFGAALFQSEGVDGISVCDTRFSYGCFHQFLGDAITTLGMGSVKELNAKCFESLSESPLSCQHGIGHGALAAEGYDDASLVRALLTCRDLPGADSIGGCSGGVFMEYNTRTMLGDQATPREYKGNPFEPCDALDAAFVAACIYWQPQWWTQTSVRELILSDAYEKMGEYCRTFDSGDRARACFEGLGNVVAERSGFDAAKARGACDTAGRNERERLLCRSVGANHFGIDVSAQAAAALCDGLSSEAHSYCSAWAKNEAHIFNRIDIDP